MSPRVALATCDSSYPVRDPDGPLLVAALGAAGIEARAAVWDDPAEEWAAYDLVVVRSTWDYVHRRDQFLAWAASVPALANPAPVLAWNTDKRYLEDLARSGVPVVATSWIAPGEGVALPDGRFVVKPSVSIGALDSARFAPDQHDLAGPLIEAIHRSGRTAMVQPYVESVDTAGEVAVIFIGGQYSHSVGKRALLRGPVPDPGAALADDVIYERAADPAEVDVARRALAAVPGDRPLLYARVDVLAASDAPVVLELEATEPSLFLGSAPGSAERLAAAISAVLTG
jgi:glutathione synthase/RimK-type ligase-like ATP-grasp enzyme